MIFGGMLLVDSFLQVVGEAAAGDGLFVAGGKRDVGLVREEEDPVDCLVLPLALVGVDDEVVIASLIKAMASW